MNDNDYPEWVQEFARNQPNLEKKMIIEVSLLRDDDGKVSQMWSMIGVDTQEDAQRMIDITAKLPKVVEFMKGSGHD